MKFSSNFFKTADELEQAKNDAMSGVVNRRERLDIIRRFSNGLATLTVEEAKKLGRKEITNHLTTYSKLLQQESMFESMLTGTNASLEVVVNTGDPERDHVLGVRIAKIVNEGMIHYKGKMAGLWRKVSGEIVMAGGAPVINEPTYGWLPKIANNMIFPKKTELDAEEVTFCFLPMEFTHSDLVELLASVKGEEGHIHDVQNIRALLKTLKRQVKDRNKTSSGFANNEVASSVRKENGGMDTHIIEAYAYFEVKFRDDGSRYVSKTIFTDAMQVAANEDAPAVRKSSRDEDPSAARFISHIEEAYVDAFEFLHMVCVDSEIGGNKTTDELRGVAELMYPSGSEMESLLNLLLEGDKERAKPKFKTGNGAKVDDILKWDIEQHTMVPDGVEEFEIKANGQHLQTPFAMLDRNSSSITGAPVSNTPQGGELRVQANERRESNTGVQANRLQVAFNHLDSIYETVLWRAMAGKVKPGTEGYLQTMWVRSKFAEQGIDYEKLSQREHGRFKWLRVRAKRNIGNGDRQQQSETADWMIDKLPMIEPAVRPVVIQHAFALKTGDPDLAEMVVKPPQIILNQQRLIAENEFDTIARRAMAGLTISPQPDDIHHNHIETHLIDTQALLAEHEVEPWKMRQALVFAAALQHIGEHITILLGNKQTNFEGNRFLQAYQTLVHNGKPAVAAVQESQESEAAQLTPKEQADIDLKLAAMELEAHALGLKEADLRDTWKLRATRSALSTRTQQVREISDAQRLALEKEKVATQQKEPKKTASK